MPGVYKKKNCPNCGVEHRKRGPYCSQGCHNSHREVSDKVRDNMRKVAEEYSKTPEAIANRALTNTNLRELSADDFAVDIPYIPDDDDLPPGYERGEHW